MPNTIVVKTGATSMTPVGGSDVTFTAVQNSGKERVLKVITDPTLTSRKVVQSYVSARSQNSAPSGYTHERKKCVIHVPAVLANGKLDVSKITIEIDHSIETTAAEKLELQLLGAQALSDADLADFWSVGSTQ